MRFLNGQEAFPLTTAAQNIHVLFRKSPLCRSHFFEWLKTAISSTACGTATLKSLLSQAFFVPDVHPRPRKHLSRCTLDCGFKTSESPALRGFVGERCPIRGTSLYLVLKSNGLCHPKNLPVKFSFSSKTVPVNIAKKLPSQRCFKPLLTAFSTSRTNSPRSLSLPKAGTHSPFGERSHTAAYTPKHGPSLPRPQRGLELPVKFLLVRHAFIYIHFPVLCGPSYRQKRKSRQSCRHKFYPQPFLIPLFNFSHKWPTFTFTGESGYTRLRQQDCTQRLTRRNRGCFRWSAITTLGLFCTVRKPCVAGYQNGKLCRFWVLSGSAPEERRKPAGQRCVHACRCSAGVAAPLGCVALLPLFVQYDLAG